MKNKSFDCVNMKHSAADKIFEQLKNMSPEEQLAYWRQGEHKLLHTCKGTSDIARLAKAA